MLNSITSGCALCLGLFTLLNLVAEARCRSFTPNVWWIDLRAIPSWVAWPLLTLAALLLCGVGLTQRISQRRRNVTIVVLGLLLIAACGNILEFYVLAATGRIGVSVPVPLSCFVLGLLCAIMVALIRETPAVTWRRRLGISVLVAVSSVIAFPIGLMFFLGKTDYRRPADAIVVFGARAYADGTPSHVLADRVRTACQLYHEGLAPRLIVSGGPGEGAVHETECMRLEAVGLGVPNEAILLDPDGLNTWATAKNTRVMFHTEAFERVLAVSHFYHLPRIKMAFQRHGHEVFTVPAQQQYLYSQLPFWMAREVVAFWAYYARSIVESD